MGNIFSTRKPETKVILITGASAGIGKQSALDLIKRGHIVYGAARRVGQMQDIVKAGGHAIQLDVLSESDIVDAVKRIVQEQGRIDVLVNNAGYGVMGPVECVSMEDARRQYDVNIFGLARLTKEVIPHMRKERKGTIINISSIGGKIYMPYGAWYQSTKHALEGWSDCLRLELHPFNIKVSIVEPGFISTEFGGVAVSPVVDRIKGSPYEESVENFLNSRKKSASRSSQPSIISDVIVKASESANPKRRYLAGYGKQLLSIRFWLGDAFYDFLMLKLLK